MTGENLERLWYRKALWILLAHENPVEIECRAKETEYGPYESKLEDALQAEIERKSLPTQATQRRPLLETK